MMQLGVQAVFTRIDTVATVSLTAIVSDPEYLIESGGSSAMLAGNRADILIRADDLVFNGTKYVPSIGDTVTVTANGTACTYSAFVEDGRRYCWTWADKFNIRRRLYTKITNITPVQEQ